MNYIKHLVFVFISALVIGCSGGSDSGSNPERADASKPLTGQFIDAPVAGLQYETATRSGQTDKDGNFEFLLNESVRFFIGDIELGSAKGKSIVSPFDLAGTENIENNTVVNILRLLQTLDENGDPSDGIQLNSAALSEAIGLDTIFVTDDIVAFSTNADLQAYLQRVTGGTGLVDIQAAQAHFQDTLQEAGIGRGAGTYQVGGQVLGLNGSVTLQLNQTENLTVNQNGDFQFATEFPSGAEYYVEVISATNNQACSLLNGNGIIAKADVSTVVVVCQDQNNPSRVAVAGNIAHLTDVLQMETANGILLLVTVDGAFTFNIPGVGPEVFPIRIRTQPRLRTCTIGQANEITVDNASAATITCQITGYNVGGALINFTSGDRLVLHKLVNGAFDEELVLNGPRPTYDFVTGVPINNDVSVIINEQPNSKSCSFVAESSATNVTADINNFDIICSVNSYSISGSITNFSGNDQMILGLFISDSSTPIETLDLANAATQFAFQSQVNHGSAYAVEVIEQPLGKDCTVSSNGAGTLTGDITDIQVSCDVIQYTVEGTVSGLSGNDSLLVTLRNTTTQTDVSSVSLGAGDTAINFSGTIPFGDGYEVIKTDPSGKNCTLSGEWASPGVFGPTTKTFSISCDQRTYLISGTINGLDGVTQTANLELRVNGSPAGSITAPQAGQNTFGFTTPVPHGSNVEVAILSVTDGLNCSSSNNVLSNVTADDNSIVIDCGPNLYTVNFEVRGLGSTGGVLALLQNDLQQTIDQVSTNGDAVVPFTQKISHGSPYQVIIEVSPASHNCTLSGNSSGTLLSDITVTLSCTLRTFGVSATVSGIATPPETVGLQLVVNGSAVNDEITLDESNSSANPLAFQSQVGYGSSVTANILVQPSGKTCNASSINSIQGNAVIAIVCSQNTFTVGGTILNLNNDITIANNGTGNQVISPAQPDPTFSFTVPEGGSYNITVVSQPQGQFCTVTNGVGSSVTQDISNISINCVPTFDVSILVNTLGTGESVDIELSSSGQKPDISSIVPFVNGTTLFPNFSVAMGDTLTIRVVNSPVGRSCSVVGGTNIDNVQADTTVTIDCPLIEYPFESVISGLPSGETLSIRLDIDQQPRETSSYSAGENRYSFTTRIPHGSTFSLNIVQQPVSFTCEFRGNKDVTITDIADGPVGNYTIDCFGNTYQISGTVFNLNGRVLLLNNAVDTLIINDTGDFPFSFTVNYGDDYNISVGSEPLRQKCSVQNGSGSNVIGDVSGVIVNCVNLHTAQIVIDTLGVNETIGVQLTTTGQNNATSPIVNFSNGNTNFPNFDIYEGDSVIASIETPPDSKTCRFEITNTYDNVQAAVGFTIICETKQFILGGNITGLDSGQQLTIQSTIQGNPDPTPLFLSNGETSYQMPDLVPYGMSYELQLVQPPSLVCEFILAKSDTISGVATVQPESMDINCVANAFPVAGVITVDTGHVVQTLDLNLYIDSLTAPVDSISLDAVSAAAGPVPFSFTQKIPSGSIYQVEAITSAESTCTVGANGSSSVPVTVPIGDVLIDCGVKTVNLGGTISGLTSNDDVIIAMLMADTTTIVREFVYGGEATYNFSLPYDPTESYQFVILEQPNLTNKVCGLFDGGGRPVTRSDSFVSDQDHQIDLRCAPSFEVFLDINVGAVTQYTDDQMVFRMSYNDPILSKGTSSTPLVTPVSIKSGVAFPQRLSNSATFEILRSAILDVGGSPITQYVRCDMDVSTPVIFEDTTGTNTINGADVTIRIVCEDRLPLELLPEFGDCKFFNANENKDGLYCPETVTGQVLHEHLRDCAIFYGTDTPRSWQFADEVTSLDCSFGTKYYSPDKPVFDLIGLTYFPNLEFLILNGNPLTAAKAGQFYNIPELPKLKFMKLHNNDNTPDVFTRIRFTNANSKANCDSSFLLSVTPYDPLTNQADTSRKPVYYATRAYGSQTAQIIRPIPNNALTCDMLTMEWGDYVSIAMEDNQTGVSCTLTKVDRITQKVIDSKEPRHIFSDPQYEHTVLPAEELLINCN